MKIPLVYSRKDGWMRGTRGDSTIMIVHDTLEWVIRVERHIKGKTYHRIRRVHEVVRLEEVVKTADAMLAGNTRHDIPWLDKYNQQVSTEAALSIGLLQTKG